MMKKRLLFLLLVLSPLAVGIASAADWELIPVTVSACTVDIGLHMTPGQYELGVVAVGPTSKSTVAEADKPLVIVPAGSAATVSDPLKAKGWYVKTAGDPIVCVWEPSTYTVDGQPVEVSLYEVYAKPVNRIGPCGAPAGMRVE